MRSSISQYDWIDILSINGGFVVMVKRGRRYLTAGHRRWSISQIHLGQAHYLRLARQQWWLHTASTPYTLSLDNVGRAHNTGQTVLQTMLPTWLPTYSSPYMSSYLLSYLLAYPLAPKHASCDGFEHTSFALWPTP